MVSILQMKHKVVNLQSSLEPAITLCAIRSEEGGSSARGQQVIIKELLIFWMCMLVN
jgi:hypothetical protein